MGSSFWEVAAATISGAAAVLYALVKLVPSVRASWMALGDLFRKTETEVTASRELQASLREVRRIRALRSVLEQWVPRKGAQRALLLCANNGGEAWKGGGPLYCSNPAQIVADHEPNTTNLWQDWRVDAWYAEFLGRLLETLEKRRGLLLVRDNGVQGELHNQYIAQGTVASVVLPFIWREGGVLWYVSLNFGRYPHLPGRSPASHDDHHYDGARPLDADEERVYLRSAEEIYHDAARCRGLIDELRAAYLSVR